MTETGFPVHVVGDGPHRVVVAHGWMGDVTLYEDFIPFIDASRLSYAFFDCRGYGTRRDEAGSAAVEGIADDVLKVADSLGWETFTVLGHSMGGMAAQRLMADHPARLGSAVLLAPVPASGARIDAERRQLLESALHEPATRKTLIDANTGKVRQPEWLERVLSLSLAGTSPRGLGDYMRSWTGEGFLADAEGSAVRTLVLVGALDPGTNVERIRETYLRWYPNASLQVIQDVGHYPMLEAPAELADAVARFVDGEPSGAEMI